MSQQLGRSGKVVGTNCVTQGAAAGSLAWGWRDILAGAKLPAGPAIAILVSASLLSWAGIITGLYYMVHR